MQVPIIWLVLLCFFRPGSAVGAELRYIRIGEHKVYTRIVFEFRGEAAYKEPVVKGKGQFSVAFENTTTELPKKIAGETSKRVNVITFAQEDSRLVAYITLSFPYFEIKTFSISQPHRIVLDVTPLSKPPKGVMFEEQIARETAPEPEVATPPKPPIEPGSTGDIKPLLPPVQTKPDEVVVATQKPKASEPTKPVPAPSPPRVGSSDEAAKAVSVTDKEPARPRATEKDEPRPTQKAAPVSSVESGDSRLQTILLIVLLALSMVIVVLLAVILFRKRRIVERKDDLFEMPDVREESLEDIDDKLKRELSRLG